MPTTYQYSVRDRAGKLVSGSLDAESPTVVAQKLAAMGYAPVSITKSNPGMKRELSIPGMGKKIKLKDLAIFSRQFATMIDSGLSLLRALTILVEQTENKELGRILGDARMPGGTMLPEFYNELGAMHGTIMVFLGVVRNLDPLPYPSVSDAGWLLSSVLLMAALGERFALEAPRLTRTMLLDALLGDPTLFIRSDEVAQAWRIVDPVLEAFEEGDLPLARYEAGGWGPPEADALLDRDGRRWRKP